MFKMILCIAAGIVVGYVAGVCIRTIVVKQHQPVKLTLIKGGINGGK